MPSPITLPTDTSFARTLCGDLDASPSPYHAVEHVAAQLREAGFSALPADNPMPTTGRWYWSSGGALVAWCVDSHHDSRSPFRIIGAHTDSPNLRVKPNPEVQRAGFNQLGVEVYGGALLNSWLDRDLGLAGRVAIRAGVASHLVLVRDDRPILRVPQLAIHLDGEIRDQGLLLNRQLHMVPVWSLGDPVGFRAYLASLAGVAEHDVLAWDIMAHDLTKATMGGLHDEFLISARIDNLLSTFIATRALVMRAEAASPRGAGIAMMALFDHEEVGSVSATGAASPLLGQLLDRISTALGATADDIAASRGASLFISADGAHATHPNYVDRHEPEHQIYLNEGPVLKLNTNQRYATNAVTAAAVHLAAERVSVPVQSFVNRTDLGCGSTIGPATAGQLGIPVADMGCAQLAMHSAREMAGSADPAMFLAVLSELLR